MTEKPRPEARKTEKMLSVLATCPRRYQTEFIRNLTPKGRRPKPWPPNLKAILRDALRDRDHAEMRGLSSIRVRAAAEAVVTAYEDELVNLIGQVPKGEHDRYQATITKITTEARLILSHYADTVGREPFEYLNDEHGTPIVDRIFEAELSSETSYAGRIEAVVKQAEHPERPASAVLIRRFTSNADPQSVIAEENLNLNTMAAMWIASRASNTKVMSAVIEVVRTKAPSIPDTVQCRKCKGTGHNNDDEKTTCETCRGSGIGGMSKRGCDTTPGEWQRAITRAGLDEATETERCKDLVSNINSRGETFVYRIRVDATEDEILDWKKDVVAIEKTETHYTESNYWPRNRSACTNRMLTCPHLKSCGHNTDGDDAFYTDSVEPYPGLD